jgi:SRSO17 transposase
MIFKGRRYQRDPLKIRGQFHVSTIWAGDLVAWKETREFDPSSRKTGNRFQTNDRPSIYSTICPDKVRKIAGPGKAAGLCLNKAANLKSFQ